MSVHAFLLFLGGGWKHGRAPNFDHSYCLYSSPSLQRQFIFKRDSPSTTAAGLEITCLTHTDCCHLMVFASVLKVCVNVLTQNWSRLFS
jgi:hypothetical protein